MRKIFLFSLCITILVISIYCLTGFSPSEFHGAGPMRDSGFFSYYRYHAPLGNIPLNKEGNYKLQFSGLPDGKMALQFYLSGHSEATRKSLENLSTELSVIISDISGKTVCKAQGNLSGSNREGQWVLMSSHLNAAYWHMDCIEGVFQRGKSYTLQVAVKNVDPKSPLMTSMAMLEGGGNELP